ncbi:hypothetical protein ACMZOO_15190 [Catenovulum sp. SX2]|uniref:hypothetical protein n=1 Tax=Catenovulum sp. SX2 TaxID=3398614 RepID=UPI003F86D14B
MSILKSFVSVVAFVSFAATANTSDSLKSSVEADLVKDIKLEVASLVADVKVEDAIVISVNKAVLANDKESAEQLDTIITQVAE